MMSTAFEVARILSIMVFLYFGLSCLVSQRMVVEFERYGLSRFRKTTGWLELAGAVGLLAGFILPTLTVLASAGLSLLMATGIGVRLGIRDSASDIGPAACLLLLNAFICGAHLV